MEKLDDDHQWTDTLTAIPTNTRKEMENQMTMTERNKDSLKVNHEELRLLVPDESLIGKLVRKVAVLYR